MGDERRGEVMLTFRWHELAVIWPSPVFHRGDFALHLVGECRRSKISAQDPSVIPPLFSFVFPLTKLVLTDPQDVHRHASGDRQAGDASKPQSSRLLEGPWR